MYLARTQSLFIVFHTEQLHQFLPPSEEKMDFAEQGLKIRGRKQLIYTFLIKLMHNLFMGKGERL